MTVTVTSDVDGSKYQIPFVASVEQVSRFVLRIRTYGNEPVTHDKVRRFQVNASEDKWDELGRFCGKRYR